MRGNRHGNKPRYLHSLGTSFFQDQLAAIPRKWRRWRKGERWALVRIPSELLPRPQLSWVSAPLDDSQEDPEAIAAAMESVKAQLDARSEAEHERLKHRRGRPPKAKAALARSSDPWFNPMARLLVIMRQAGDIAPVGRMRVDPDTGRPEMPRWQLKLERQDKAYELLKRAATIEEMRSAQVRLVAKWIRHRAQTGLDSLRLRNLGSTIRGGLFSSNTRPCHVEKLLADRAARIAKLDRLCREPKRGEPPA